MTILQKLENTYLAILRLAVLAVSGLLLITTVFLLVRSLPLLKSADETIASPPVVSSDAMLEVLTTKAAPTTSQPQGGKRANPAPQDGALVTRATELVAKFVSDNSGGTVTLNVEKLSGIIRHNAANQATPALKSAYLNGLVVAAEKTLTHPSILALLKASKAANTSANATDGESQSMHPALQIASDFLEKYRGKFNDELAAQEKAKLLAVQSRAQEQVSATTSLYASGVAFAAFLLIVFLSIFIGIERNLRPRSEHAPELAP